MWRSENIDSHTCVPLLITVLLVAVDLSARQALC